MIYATFRKLRLYATGALVTLLITFSSTITPLIAKPNDLVVTGKRAIDPVPTRIVRYGDLDLASLAGEKALNQGPHGR